MPHFITELINVSLKPQSSNNIGHMSLFHPVWSSCFEIPDEKIMCKPTAGLLYFNMYRRQLGKSEGKGTGQYGKKGHGMFGRETMIYWQGIKASVRSSDGLAAAIGRQVIYALCVIT